MLAYSRNTDHGVYIHGGKFAVMTTPPKYGRGKIVKLMGGGVPTNVLYETDLDDFPKGPQGTSQHRVL